MHRSAMLFLLLLLVAPPALAATRLVTVGGVDAGDCTGAPCATLSYAIAQAVDGDTIDVGPGTFANGGAPVIVNKTLIVRGEQAGVDARGRVATETILTAPVVLAEDSIVFDGFTVSCGLCTGVGAGIATSPSFSGYHVTNNIVTGNPRGIFGGTSGVIQWVIDRNHITANNVADLTLTEGYGIRADATNLRIDNNWIDNHSPANVYISGSDASPASVIITNNRIAPAVGDGVVINGNIGSLIEGNTISGAAAAIYLTGGNGAVELHFNRIVNNVTDLQTDAGASIDGENNWWGCNEGPSVCATLSLVAPAAVDLDPWIVMDIAAAPATIAPTETSVVTADFLQNSDGVPISGTFEAIVMFAATNGTMTPPADDLDAGVASSTFHPAGAGIATVSASLDEETVSTNVIIIVGAQTDAAEIPVLSPLMLVLLALTFAAVGSIVMRR